MYENGRRVCGNERLFKTPYRPLIKAHFESILVQ